MGFLRGLFVAVLIFSCLVGLGLLVFGTFDLVAGSTTDKPFKFWFVKVGGVESQARGIALMAGGGGLFWLSVHYAYLTLKAEVSASESL